ncbi:MAG: EscU/YscU/HrcU family type III secretion system export apparatus switch protein, partial [Acidobacteriota bacterium]
MEARPFPPSPRRRALAHRAGLHAASPVVVGALACAAALAATASVARAGATNVGAWIAAACDGRASVAMADLARAVLELAAPIVAAAAVVAAAAHFAQTRALWLPRRRVDGAPAMTRGAPLRAAFELGAPAVVAATGPGWLWRGAPRLARAGSLADAGALLASFVGGGHRERARVLGVADERVADAEREPRARERG